MKKIIKNLCIKSLVYTAVLVTALGALNQGGIHPY